MEQRQRAARRASDGGASGAMSTARSCISSRTWPVARPSDADLLAPTPADGSACSRSRRSCGGGHRLTACTTGTRGGGRRSVHAARSMPIPADAADARRATANGRKAWARPPAWVHTWAMSSERGRETCAADARRSSQRRVRSSGARASGTSPAGPSGSGSFHGAHASPPPQMADSSSTAAATRAILAWRSAALAASSSSWLPAESELVSRSSSSSSASSASHGAIDSSSCSLGLLSSRMVRTTAQCASSSEGGTASHGASAC